MSEPMFAVPLSALIDFDYDVDGDGYYYWSCARLSPSCMSSFREVPSESEARSAAIEHLRQVHGIRPLAEDGAADVVDTEWTRHMRSLLGKQLKVTLQYEPSEVSQVGLLMSFDIEGQVALRDETGCVHWCWPALGAVEFDR